MSSRFSVQTIKLRHKIIVRKQMQIKVFFFLFVRVMTFFDSNGLIINRNKTISCDTGNVHQCLTLSLCPLSDSIVVLSSGSSRLGY